MLRARSAAPAPNTPAGPPRPQSAKREAVLGLVAQLEGLNPTPRPLQHMERLQGDWRLLFTTITITVGGHQEGGLICATSRHRRGRGTSRQPPGPQEGPGWPAFLLPRPSPKPSPFAHTQRGPAGREEDQAGAA
jgi:hypothetical protein